MNLLSGQRLLAAAPIPNRISRRAFIQTALAALVVGGCLPQSPENTPLPQQPALSETRPVSTPAPRVTPTSPPAADGPAQAYLSAWQQGDFETMYQLLSPVSQRRITLEQLVFTYQNAFGQTTATSIQPQLQSLLSDGLGTTAMFHSRWQTALFDTIEADHTMSLRFERGGWFVEWEPTLVLPQLGYGVRLALLAERLSRRGNIYDDLDRLLASNEQMIRLGVVIAVILENAGEGSEKAAPLFRLMMEAYFDWAGRVLVGKTEDL